jgi:hypothetical protein
MKTSLGPMYRLDIMGDIERFICFLFKHVILFAIDILE